MANKYVQLAASGTSATTTGKYWVGGRASILLSGTLPTTLKLQILAQDNSTWIDVATLTTTGKQAADDYPPGNYRLSLAGGSPSLAADMYGIQYE